MAATEDNQALDDTGRRDGRAAIGGQCGHHLFCMRILTLKYRDDRAGIDDHVYTPDRG